MCGPGTLCLSASPSSVKTASLLWQSVKVLQLDLSHWNTVVGLWQYFSQAECPFGHPTTPERQCLLTVPDAKVSEWGLTSRSTHYRSFRRRSSRQSLALVQTTKINSKINQTNTKKTNTTIYCVVFINFHYTVSFSLVCGLGLVMTGLGLGLVSSWPR